MADEKQDKTKTAQATGTPDTASSNVKEDNSIGDPKPEAAGTKPAPGSEPVQDPAQAERDRTQNPKRATQKGLSKKPSEDDLQDPSVRSQLASRAETERLNQANQTSEEYPEDSKQFEGQAIVSEHFALATRTDGNGTYVELKRRNGVGDEFRIAPSQVSELVEAFGKVKNLPKN